MSPAASQQTKPGRPHVTRAASIGRPEARRVPRQRPHATRLFPVVKRPAAAGSQPAPVAQRHGRRALRRASTPPMRGIGGGRIGRGAVGVADLRVYFVTVHGRRWRRDDAEADAVAADAQHADLDAVADDDGFAPAAGEDQHGGVLGRRHDDVPQRVQAVLRHHLLTDHRRRIDHDRRAQIGGDGAVGLDQDDREPEQRRVSSVASAGTRSFVLEGVAESWQHETRIDGQKRRRRPFDRCEPLKRRRVRREQREAAACLEARQAVTESRRCPVRRSAPSLSGAIAAPADGRKTVRHFR